VEKPDKLGLIRDIYREPFFRRYASDLAKFRKSGANSAPNLATISIFPSNHLAVLPVLPFRCGDVGRSGLSRSPRPGMPKSACGRQGPLAESAHGRDQASIQARRSAPSPGLPGVCRSGGGAGGGLEQTLPSSTFHDRVNDGIIVPIKGVPGFHKLNESQCRLGLRPVRTPPKELPGREFDSSIRLREVVAHLLDGSFALLFQLA